MSDTVTTTPRGIGGRTRQILAAILVVLFGLSYLSSGVGIWLHRNTLNRDVWNERVVPLGENPEVQKALAAWTTEQLMATVKPQDLIENALPGRAKILATPLSSAVEGFVADKVDQFYASDNFAKIWRLAATKAHDEAIAALRGEYGDSITADSQKIQINLIPLINAVLNEIVAQVPGLVGADVTLPKIDLNEVPDKARQRLADALGVKLEPNFGTITIYDGGKLSTAQKAVRWFDQAVIATTILTFVTVAAALALSQRRRRTLFQLLGAAAIAAIAVRRVCFMLRKEVNGLVTVDLNRDAANVVTSTFVRPLTNTAAISLWVIALVAFIAWITGPYRWAVSVRTLAVGTAGTVTHAVGDKARDPGTTDWIVANGDTLRFVGYGLGALMLWFVQLSWVSFFLIVAFVVVWQVVLHRIAPSGAGADDGGSGDGGGSGADRGSGDAG